MKLAWLPAVIRSYCLQSVGRFVNKTTPLYNRPYHSTTLTNIGTILRAVLRSVRYIISFNGVA